jgi:hypothetical protein
MFANQVAPDGSLVSAPRGTRGLMMGNRGILLPKHFDLPQPFAIKPWIACVLNDKNNLPLPKTEVKYARLFLLDEVTAFAAGHRPCGQCQRKRYMDFVDVWCKANRKDRSLLDDHLHAERCDSEGLKRKDASALKDLPGGTMVQLSRDGEPHLWLWGKVFPWSVQGYQAPVTVPNSTVVQILTPSSIVKALRAGFPLPLNSETTVHPSVVAHVG